METIKCSAILKDDKIYIGHRHHNIIRQIVEETGITPAGGIQGFYTSEERFVDRIEAASIALKSGQIEKLQWPPNLYSEDLY